MKGQSTKGRKHLQTNDPTSDKNAGVAPMTQQKQTIQFKTGN